MAKIGKKLQKNIKKNIEKSKKEYPVKNKIIYFAKIVACIIILATLAFLITSISNGTYKMAIKEKDYSNILAGQTFNKSDSLYYVVFYYNDDESDITEAIKNVTSPIYHVNLSLESNKGIISTVSTPDSNSASELKIKDITVIKISDGKNVEFIEGKEEVVAYLKTL